MLKSRKMKEKLDFLTQFDIITAQGAEKKQRCNFLIHLLPGIQNAGGVTMRRSRSRAKPINRKLLFIRLYVSLLSLMLAASVMALVTQSVYAAQDDPGETAAALSDTYGRGYPVTVCYHGNITRTTANGETAGELLDRLGLVLSGEDVVSCELDMVTFEGMTLSVDRVVTRQESYSVSLPRDTRHCADPTIPLGTEQLLTAGQDGELLRQAQVTYVNGTERSRQVLEETVIRHPVTQVVGVGTGQEEETEGELTIGEGLISLPTGEVLTYTDTATIRATAYTQTDPGCTGITATGTNVRRGAVAVDPRYIPYGTRMFIVTASGSYVYGVAVAEDCGGDIKGDRMDLYFPTYEECREFGRRVCTVYFLG